MLLTLGVPVIPRFTCLFIRTRPHLWSLFPLTVNRPLQFHPELDLILTYYLVPDESQTLTTHYNQLGMRHQFDGISYDSNSMPTW